MTGSMESGPATKPKNRVPGLLKNLGKVLRSLHDSLFPDLSDPDMTTPHRPELTELEPRVLYSASPMANLAAEVENDVVQIDLDGDGLPTPDETGPSDAEIWLGEPVDVDSSLLSTETADSASLYGTFLESSTAEIIFLDAGVEDFEYLYESLTQSSTAEQRYEVVVLHQDRDGIRQISEALANRDDISGVHIFSHGDDGVVRLGSSILNANALGGYAAELSSWNDSLTLDADILFYGCNLAESEVGAE